MAAFYEIETPRPRVEGGHLRSVAATRQSGHLRPLAATREKRPLAATRVAASGCKWLLFMTSATRRRRPLAVTCGHSTERPLAATCGHSSGCEWLQVAAFLKFKYRAECNPNEIRGVALGVEFEIGKGGHLRPLAATCRKRPLAATCGHLTEAATCGHLRPLALCGHLRSLAATCPLRSLAVTGQVWSVTCSSGHLRPVEWLQVAASDRE